MVKTAPGATAERSAVVHQIVEVATSADVPRLAEMGEVLHNSSAHRALTFSRTRVEALLHHLIADPAGVIFVARDRGRVVGAFAGAVAPQWYSDDLVAFDYSFFVDPDARHGMRSSALIQAFVIWAERRGARQVKVGITTGIDVAGTSRLYKSLGFVDAGVGFSKEIINVHRT